MGICKYLSGVDLDGELIKVECIKHECDSYRGDSVQRNGGEVEIIYMCEDSWMVELTKENTRFQMGTQAAIESLRNVVDSDKNAMLAAQQRQLEQKLVS